MPVYTVQGPDKRTYDIEGPEGATAEDLGAFIEQSAQQNYSNEGRMHPLVNPDAQGGILDRYGAGVSGALDTFRAKANDAIKKVFPNDSNRQSIFGGPAMQPKPDPELEASIQRARNRSALYEQSKDQLGFAGTLGDITPEIAATAVPIAKAGTALARAPMLAKALGRYAPAVGDIAANAAYSGGKAAAQGKDAGEVAFDALLGAGGAVAGRALPRAIAIASKPVAAVVNRATTGMSPEARMLLEQGITPTPGQAFPDSLTAMAENASKVLPGYGAAVERAQGRTGAQYASRELNNAMAPLGVQIDEQGFKAVARANQIISESYEAIKPHIELPFFARPQAVNAAVRSIRRDIPLLSQENASALQRFIQQRVLNRGGNPLDRLDGEAFKDLDTEIGKIIRARNGPTASASDHEMADAFSTLQQHLRARLAPVANASPMVKAQLDATNQAFRNMVPVAKAVDRAGNKSGAFTPNQYRNATPQGGALNLSGGPLNDAAMQVVGPTGTSGKLTRGVLGGVGVGLHFDPSTLATIAAGSAIGHAVYSERGVRVMLGAMNLLPHIRQWVEGLPITKQAEFVGRMVVEDPRTRQLASQIGARLAQPQGVQQ